MPSPRLHRWIRSSLVAGAVAACSSAVTDAPVTHAVKMIALIGPADSLRLDETDQIMAIDEVGRPVASPALVWSSSAPSVASVSPDGLLTARGLGMATITATLDSLHADFAVRVGNYPNPLQIRGISDSLDVGGTYQLSANVLNAIGELQSPPGIQWSSSSPAVVSVSASGLVAAHTPGQATITASNDVVSTTLVVSVRMQFSVAILPDGEFGDTLQIAPGEALNLVALAGGGPTIPTDEVVWSSSAPGVATVTQAGLVTGVASGTATIAAIILQRPVTRTIRVAATGGTVTIRMISAADAYSTVTMHPNVGAPATLAYGAASEQVVPAGTLQLSFDGVPPLTNADPRIYGAQVFVGFLPAGGHETFIAVSNTADAPNAGPLTIAFLDDRTEAVPADSALLRVVLATSGAFNVFFTDPGASPSMIALQGCYLDWPFGFTSYTNRPAGDFDIVLVPKGSQFAFGPEAARLHATVTAGHASTFIVTGSGSSFRVLSLVDR